MSTNQTPASWVAFDKQGFPYGFADANAYTLNEAIEEFRSADRLEWHQGESRSALLRKHAGVDV